MRFQSLSVLALGCGMLFVTGACSDAGSEAAKGAALRFANYSKLDQRDSIIVLYPEAEFAEEFRADLSADSLTVSKTDKEGVYEVKCGQSASMLVEVNKDGAAKILSSKGLFKYSPAKMLFAQKTGAVKGELNDDELAKRMIQVDNMSTDLFNDYVELRKNAIKNLGTTVTREPEGGFDYGEGYYTLKNTTDEPIGGDEYELTYEIYYANMTGNPKPELVIEPGKDIEPRGTVRLKETFTWHSGRTLKAITVHTPSQESFFKNYQPTGQEYADYLRAHGDENVKVSALSYGPYALAGKLGGKYAIHVNLDKGMKKGSYYYYKSGANNTLNLVVKAFNARTGELTIEETNNKGEVTGTFIGVLTADTYTGKMTSYQGKTYDFTLNVVK